MKITYDKIADAIYLKINDAKIKTTKKINDRLNVDMDKDGNVVGIEMLDASSKQAKTLEENIKNGVPIEIVSGTPLTA